MSDIHSEIRVLVGWNKCPGLLFLKAVRPIDVLFRKGKVRCFHYTSVKIQYRAKCLKSD